LFDLPIGLTRARGLDVPEKLLALADEVFAYSRLFAALAHSRLWH